MLPLTSHAPDAIIAWTRHGPVSAARFAADARRLAALLPPGRHVLNLCQDRYHFMVGFAAGLISDRISLQPSSQTPETVRQLRLFAPDLFCLHDGQGEDVDLPRLRYPEAAAGADATAPIPDIPVDRVAAYVFTSGSTGMPVPHRKTWGALGRNARAGAAVLGVDRSRPAIVGTVPPQHMYGFESTVLLALHGGGATFAGRPFYPADIVAALAAVPQPRLLVTTPFHLRSLLDAGIALPAVDLLLSATAPLSPALAAEAEACCAAPLHEIYGCTETGQIATRRTVAGREWMLFDGVSLAADGERCVASGGHVEGRVPLGDRIECLDARRFILHGRSADLVNIAGKRTSISYLDHQLLAIPGVSDGAFFLPDEDDVDGITRLAACVVAPQLTPRELRQALRQRVDAAFLPRPLLFVDALPRNATGKLPRAALLAMLPRGGGEEA